MPTFEELTERQASAAAGEASPALPRCSRFATAVGKLSLGLLGWRTQSVVLTAPKFVMIAAPHTSNWDVFFMLTCGWALGLRVSWVGKHTLFRFPFGGLMRFLGGIPIDRRKRSNLVDQVAAIFREREGLIVGVSPEGTRGHTEYWRSGFYYMAKQAGVPIGLGFLDYARKVGGIQALFQPTGDIHADMDFFREAYRGVRGKRAAGESVPRLKDEERSQSEAIPSPSEAGGGRGGGSTSS